MAARCCKADAIVVLGCRNQSALRRRLEIGIRLFEAGAAPMLVLSGGGRGPLPEAEAMRRAAIAYGVPEAALLIEPLSRNTFENARETAQLLTALGRRSVLLVSDRAHLPRAAVLFRLAGLRVVGRAGTPAPPLGRSLGAAIREIIALPCSLLRWAITSRTGPASANTIEPQRASHCRSTGTAPGC
jgi:uncharacterized SAM-binding protein YcdF (DUF218 family)